MSRKVVDFAEKVEFRGITINNRKVLVALAESSKNLNCIMTFKMIGDACGLSKQAAKNNVRKLESLGILSCNNQYRINDKMPYNYRINIKWVDYGG